MYKACIFDLDGTLLNTVEAFRYCVNNTLSKYGYSQVSPENIKQFVGDGYKKLVERALAFSGDKELEHYEDALIVYMDHFSRNCMYGVKPYDGIKDMLDFLKNEHIHTAVLTNKPYAQAVENITGFFGDDTFEIIMGETPGVPKKPDPSGVFALMDKFKIKPSECLYAGDTNTDMRTGLNAGVDTIGVTWGFRDRSELESFAPKYIITHPSEIEAIIKRGC